MWFSKILLLIVSLLLSPFAVNAFSPTGMNLQRLATVIFLAGTTIYALFLACTKRQFFPECLSSTPRVPIWLALPFLVISSLLADEPMRAFQDLGFYCGLVLLVCVLYRELSGVASKQREKWYCCFVLGVATVYAISLVFNFLYVLSYEAGPGNVWVVFPNFPNPRLFNHIQAVLLPSLLLSLHLLAKRESWIFLPFATLVAYVWMIALFYSEGRGIVLSLLIGAFLTVCVSQPFRKVAGYQAALLASGYLAYALIFQKADAASSYSDRVTSTTSSGRLELWLNCLSYITEHPFAGVGGQHYVTLGEGFGSPHNMPLLWAVEYGVPAALIVLLWVAGRFRVLLRSSTALSLQGAGRIWALSTVLCYSLFTGNLLSPISQLMIALLVAMVMSDYQLQRRDATGWPGILFLCTGAALMVFVSLMDVTLFQSSLSDTEEGRWWPRFWLNGHFHNY